MFCCVTALLFVLLIQLDSDDDSLSKPSRSIAAVVDGYEISTSRVDRHLKKTLGNRQVEERALPILKRESLDHLINRHVVLATILNSGAHIGPAGIALEVSKLNDRLDEIDKPLDEYLAGQRMTKDELEYEIRWKLAWGKYLRKHITDETMQSYFQKNRRKFDGTEMKVAHLLLDSTTNTRDSAIAKANAIMNSISNGEENWTSAVKRNSIAKTSSDNNGEIGWIKYSGPMPMNFCREAMSLKVGEISAPVETDFGIHLIKCLEIKNGKIGSKDARQEIRSDATRFLFEKIAKANRDESKIQILVNWK